MPEAKEGSAYVDPNRGVKAIAGKPGKSVFDPNRGVAEPDTDPKLIKLVYATAGLQEAEALLLQARSNMQEAGAMNCKTRQWFKVAIASSVELRKYAEKLNEAKT